MAYLREGSTRKPETWVYRDRSGLPYHFSCDTATNGHSPGPSESKWALRASSRRSDGSRHRPVANCDATQGTVVTNPNGSITITPSGNTDFTEGTFDNGKEGRKIEPGTGNARTE